jgi:hypothetical protein
MALTPRRLSTILLLAAAIGCPKPVAQPSATITGDPILNGILVGQVVKLDGSTSKDPQSRDLTYTWSFSSLPPGSNATITDTHAQISSFVADIDGKFVVQLIVSNAFISSTPVTQTFNVTKCGGQAPVTGTLVAKAASGATAIGVGTLVSLTAPDAFDPDNKVDGTICTQSQNQTLTYQWKLVAQPPASTASLNNAAAQNPSFVPDMDGNYTVRLVLTDSTNRSTTSADLTITASKCGANAPSVDLISAAADRPGVGVNVQLTATVSDADNTATCGNLGVTFSYAWSLPQLPIGSRAALNSPAAQNPSFVPDIDGNYTVRLVVTASNGRSSLPKDLPIPIVKCGNNAPVATVVAPASSYIGGLVQLGATVTDADRDTCVPSIPRTFTYSWALRALPAGSNAQLNNATGTNPSFLPDVSGVYRVELIVTDNIGLKSAPASATVAVINCGAFNPVIDSLTAPTAQINAGDLVTITSAAHDPDNDPPPASATSTGCGLSQTLTYAWSLTSRPRNSNGFITNPTAANAQFTADAPNGNYQAQLVVTDSTGRSSAPKVVNINTSACGTAVPAITSAIASNGNPNPGVQVTLTATANDADNSAACPASAAQVLSFNWSVVNRPAGSGAALSNPGVFNPSFKPDVIGTYQFSVTVTASPSGNVSAPSFVTLTTTTCGSAVPTVTASANNSTVDPFTLVQFTAVAASADQGCLPAGQPTFTYAWKKISAPSNSSAVLSDPTIPNPSIKPDVFGSYQFQVITTASNGLSSQPAYVKFDVDNCALLSPTVGPVSHTGNTIGTSVTLTAGPLTDSNCLAPATSNHIYSWTMVSKPAGSQSLITAPTTNGNSTTPGSTTFTPDKVGDYQIQLIVTNGQGFTSQPSYHTVTAQTCAASAPTFAAAPNDITSTNYYPPSSTTALSSTLDVGVRMQLAANVTASSTGCGSVSLTPYTYKWALIALPATSKAALTSNTDVSPSFIPDVQGTYQVAATVTDALGNATPTRVETFSTSNCGANVPVGTINGTFTGVTSLLSVPLTATVFDADNDGTAPACPARFKNGGTACNGGSCAAPFTYSWSISSRPAGTSPVLTTPTGSATNFQASTGGPYEVQLVVTDASGLASAATKQAINVSNCGSSVPRILNVTTSQGASGSQSVVSRPVVGTTSAQMVTLQAVADSADNIATGCNMNKTFTYSWSVVSLPSGSTVPNATSGGVFGSPPAPLTSSSLNFYADVAGTYVFSVTTTDSTGLTSAPMQVTIQTAACGPTMLGVIGSTTAVPTIAPTTSLPMSGGTTSPILGDRVTLQIIQPKTTTPATPLVQDVCVTSPSFSYQWTLLSRPTTSQATVATPTALTSSFSPDVAGTYQVQLIVTDNAGLASAPQIKTFQAASCGQAKPLVTPISTVNATVTGTANVGAVVQLSATVSEAANSACLTNSVALDPYQYRWSLISAPAGSKATLSATTATGTAVAATSSPGAGAVHFVPDVQGGDYQFSVTVTDALGNVSDPQFKTVHATLCGANVPVAPAIGKSGATALFPTTADVNSNFDLTLTENAFDPNTVDGTTNGTACPTVPSASSPAFPTGTITKYAWSIVSSTPVNARASLTSSSSNPTTFRASTPGTFAVQVVVTSSNGLTNTQTGTVVASPCGSAAPQVVSLASSVARPPVGSSATLTATIYDADTAAGGNCGATPTIANVATGYTWSIVSAPAGNTVTILSTDNTSTLSKTPNVAGTYVFSVVYTDAQGLASAPVQITVPTGTCFPSAQASGTVTIVGGAGSISATVAGTTSTVTWTTSDANTATLLASAINASAANTKVTAAASGTVVTITAIAFGPSGDSITLSAAGTGVTASGATLNEISSSPAAPPIGASVTMSHNTFTDVCVSNAPPPTLSWSITSRPARSNAVIASASADSPTFVPDVPGNYTVQLVVTDVGGFSNVLSTAVVAGGCTSAPTIVGSTCANGICTPTAGAVYTYVASDPNLGTLTSSIYRDDRVQVTMPLSSGTSNGLKAGNCGAVSSTTFTYSWSMLSKPTGSQSQLSSATDISPVFTADSPGGTYQLMLVVKDSLGNASTPYVQSLTTLSTCGANKPTSTFGVTGTLNTNTTIALDAATPADPNASCPLRFLNAGASSYSYAWVVTPQANTSGGAATLSAAAGQHVTMRVSKGGDYIVQLTTTNFDGASNNADAGVNANPKTVTFNPCNGRAPTVPTPTVSQAVPVGQTFTAAGALAVGFPVTLSDAAVSPDNAPQDNTCNAGKTLSYAWTLLNLPAGSRATLTNANTPFPSINPDVKSASWTVGLTVTDNLGYSTTLATPLTLTTTACGTNPPAFGNPALVATQGSITFNSSTAPASVTVNVGSAVTLTAPGITDADTAAGCLIPLNISYAWKFTFIQAGSAAVLNGASTASPSFIPDVKGEFDVLLTITDGQGYSSTSAALNVTSNCGAALPVVKASGSVPVPLFALSQTVPAGTVVPGGKIIRTSDAGFAANAGFPGIPSPANASTQFYQGYPIQVQVTPDSTDNASGCNMGKTFSYSWSIAAQPAGSTAAFLGNNATQASPSFTPDLAGEYDLQLVLTDSTARSTTTIMKLRANGATDPVANVGACGGNTPTAVITATAPVVSAAGDSAVGATSGTTVSLDGSTSSTLDFTSCGLTRTLSYKWNLASAPAGFTGNLTSTTLSNPQLTPTLTGDYGLTLAVSDGTRTGSASLTVNVAAGGGVLSTPATTTGPVFSSMALDQSGKPVVGWIDQFDGSVKVARCAANCTSKTPTWGAAMVVDQTVGAMTGFTGNEEAPRPIQLRINTNGANILYVAYHALTKGGSTTAAACSVTVAVRDLNATPGAFSYANVATGSNCPADGLTAGAAPSADDGRWLSMDINPNTGLPGVAYSVQDFTNNKWVTNYRECTAAGCTALSVATNIHTNTVNSGLVGFRAGRWTSLRFDGATPPVAHLAWYLDTDAAVTPNTKLLRYTRCASCSTTVPLAGNELTVDSVALNAASTDEGRYAHIDVAAPNSPATSGNANWMPRIAYFDGGTTKQLKFATCSGTSGGACTAFALQANPSADSSTSFGQHTDLVLDSNGFPRIAYVDRTNSLVKVISQTSVGGPFSTVASTSGLSAVSLVTFSGGVGVSLGDLGGVLRVFEAP